MKNEFLASPKSYKPQAEPNTPYDRGFAEWTDRYGTQSNQIKNWRIATFLSIVMAICVSLIAYEEVHKSKIVPVFVGIDKERGEPMVLGPETSQYKPGPLEIKYFISQFIRFVRSVPTDAVLIKQNWLRAYAFLKNDAAGLLNEMTNKDADSPLKKIGHVIVSIQPITVVQIPDTDSYQVRWKETEYSSSGMKNQEYTMLATFVLEIDPPKDEQTLQENPLGIYIKSFQWNREL